MIKEKSLLHIITVCLLFISIDVLAVDPTLHWKTIEGEHLFVHYADGNKSIAERALVIAERAHTRLTKEFAWYPAEKTHVVISDQSDQPNGFASPVYFNHTVLFVTPPTSINTLEDFDDWLTTLIVHEYTHIIHLDKSAGSPEYLRNIFGRFLLLFPNAYQPAWILEGLATYKETDVERGIGRGQSTLFASMMREEVANGLQTISHVNLPVSTWPGGTTRYLYGVYFMNFLAEKYGEEKLHDWIEEYSNNLLPFFINTNAQRTLGKNLEPLWNEFQHWLKNKFELQINKIREKGLIAGSQLSADAYLTDSVQAFLGEHGEEVYYVQNNGYQREKLMHLDANGNTAELIDLTGSAKLDVHPEAGLLLTQNEVCNNYNVYSDIYYFDKSNKQLKRLTKCDRYLFASWFPDGKRIAAVQHDASHFELQLLDEQAKLQQVLWQGNNRDIIGQIDVSPDGKDTVASIWREGEGWNLELFNLADKRWKKINTGAGIAANPQFSPQGDILFSLENEGVYNLHQYSLKLEKVKMLTNLIGGAFQSSQASIDGPVYYAGYSAEGFAIYKLEIDKHSVASGFVKPPVSKNDHLKVFDYQVKPHQQKNYSALSNMHPRWWFPAFQFSDQRSEWGVTTTGADALGIHNYSISVSYDSKIDKPAAQFSYAYADRLYLSAARLNEIRLNNNGSMNRISNRRIVSAVAAFSDRRIQSQLDLLLSVIYDNTTDDELFSGALPYNDFEDHLLGVALLHNSSDLNPLSISLIDGMQLRLVAEDSDVLNSDFSGQVYTLDWRQYIRTGKESVFAIRFLQGWGTNNPRPFKLGGDGTSDDALNILFGQNYEAVFDVRSYALRGYKEGWPQLIGRRVQLFSGEWRFPLERIEKGFMTPPAGIMQWFGAIFVETGSAYRDSPDSYYTSAGLELTADINLFYSLTLRTRLGYAHGFDREIGEDRVYLKIGSSF